MIVKGIYKSVLIVLTVILAFTMIISCVKTPEESSSKPQSETQASTGEVLEELTLPLTENKEELTVWTLYMNNFVPDPNDLPGVQKLEEITNVHINWIPVGLAELVEKFTQLMVSRNLPDIIYISGMEFPGGVQQGIDDGFLMDVTDLVAKYMPNYRKILYSDPGYLREIITDEGRFNYIAGFNYGLTKVEPPRDYAGLAVRKDILDKYDKAIPETMDEWYNTLTFFKEQGMTMPLKVGPGGFGMGGSFITAFDVGDEFYIDNGEVRYGPLEPGYKQWIETMRKWYDEGLIDPNFSSVGEGAYIPDATAVATDNSLAFTTLFTFTADGLYKSGFTKNPDIYLKAVTNPVMNRGDAPKSTFPKNCAVQLPVFITSQCKNPQLAAKWIDYQFTVEGMLLNFLGVEGETYLLNEDGTFELTDYVLNNPDGKKPMDVISISARGNGLGLFFGRLDEFLSPESPRYDSQTLWSSQKRISYPYRATMTPEEQMDFNEKMTAINTELLDKTVRYITGQESMDTYDSLIDRIISFGIYDCLEYKKAAYERYMSRG